MTKELKQKIDRMWMETEVGEWVRVSISSNPKLKEEFVERIFQKCPNWTGYLMSIEKELSKEIAKELKTV